MNAFLKAGLVAGLSLSVLSWAAPVTVEASDIPASLTDLQGKWVTSSGQSGSSASFTLSGNVIEGTDGCNRYQGTVEFIPGGHLRFADDVLATEMFCSWETHVPTGTLSLERTVLRVTDERTKFWTRVSSESMPAPVGAPAVNAQGQHISGARIMMTDLNEARLVFHAVDTAAEFTPGVGQPPVRLLGVGSPSFSSADLVGADRDALNFTTLSLNPDTLYLKLEGLDVGEGLAPIVMSVSIEGGDPIWLEVPLYRTSDGYVDTLPPRRGVSASPRLEPDIMDPSRGDPVPFGRFTMPPDYAYIMPLHTANGTLALESEHCLVATLDDGRRARAAFIYPFTRWRPETAELVHSSGRSQALPEGRQRFTNGPIPLIEDARPQEAVDCDVSLRLNISGMGPVETERHYDPLAIRWQTVPPVDRSRTDPAMLCEALDYSEPTSMTPLRHVFDDGRSELHALEGSGLRCEVPDGAATVCVTKNTPRYAPLILTRYGTRTAVRTLVSEPVRVRVDGGTLSCEPVAFSENSYARPTIQVPLRQERTAQNPHAVPQIEAFEGVLRLSDQGCPVIRTDDAQDWVMIFPRGATWDELDQTLSVDGQVAPFRLTQDGHSGTRLGYTETEDGLMETCGTTRALIVRG
jgi:heat shock protein HslJ